MVQRFDLNDLDSDLHAVAKHLWCLLLHANDRKKQVRLEVQGILETSGDWRSGQVKFRDNGDLRAVLMIGGLPEVALDDLLFDVDALEREVDDEGKKAG